MPKNCIELQEVKADAWDLHAAGFWLCVTTNGTVTKEGKLVMGAGIAGQAEERYPKLPTILGKLISKIGNHVHVIPQYRLLSFPVKDNWWEVAKIKLIKQSCLELCDIFEPGSGNNLECIPTDKPIYLPRPGCGMGKLRWADVKPAIEGLLPSNVVIVNNQ